MGHIILDGIKWDIIVIFRIFAPRYNISLTPQDGHHPEKSPVNNDLQAK